MDTELQDVFEELGLSLLLGLLVGLEREHANSRLAGVRTFPLVTLLGAVCAMLAAEYGGWVIAAGLLGVASLVVIGNVAKLWANQSDPGVTTEAALLLMFMVGGVLVVGPRSAGVAVAGAVAVLLKFKPQLHGFVERLQDREVQAIMRFVLIAFIILPVLPDETYGPFEVFNPFEMWLLVVMIVGISLGGYIAYKFLGQGAGTLLGGILGGAISSTATTVSYARRTARDGAGSLASATVILIATSVVYVRVLIEVYVMSPSFFPTALPPVLILMGLAVLPAVGLWFFSRQQREEMPEQDDPAEFREALFFALMYVGVLFGLALAKTYFGQRGLYGIAILSGLTDMDAITLSASRMVERQEIEMGVGWRMIVLAAMANLVFKAGLVGALGNRRMFAWVAALFGISLVGGGLLFFFWPGTPVTLPAMGPPSESKQAEEEDRPSDEPSGHDQSRAAPGRRAQTDAAQLATSSRAAVALPCLGSDQAATPAMRRHSSAHLWHSSAQRWQCSSVCCLHSSLHAVHTSAQTRQMSAANCESRLIKAAAVQQIWAQSRSRRMQLAIMATSFSCKQAVAQCSHA